ncbi:AAA family ATPase [Vibrio vulnificus]|nr:ATP-binding protein [Vibrio vulnificus]EIJ0958710.1 ATP-binding protein [Vibrio vulnificus]EIJ0986436.1 ATP-binding protein [Vibrio vulnificus]ELP3504661.1 ATP-binding protein [Vibrio vulnificus]ELP3553505.1 ATP-binding protein [Vibrio vulnificus]
MQIQSIVFKENIDRPDEWHLSCSDIFDVNLIVAQNGTGKSRTLRVLNYLFLTISDKTQVIQNSNFIYDVVFFEKKSNTTYNYKVECENGNIKNEHLIINNKTVISRRDKMVEAYYSKLNLTIETSLDTTKFAISQADETQKDYLVPLVEFSKQVLMVNFGTDLGQNTFTVNGLLGIPKEQIDESNLRSYINSIVSFFHFSKAFDFFNELCEAIKNDMNHIGYSIEEVSIEESGGGLLKGKPMDRIYVKETDIKTRIYQDLMSQGMFRAFAALTILNYLDISNKSGALLIDDIGEGLDFERSSKLIELIIDKCSQKDIQCLLSSNDKFVMNKIPLEHWQIISRNAHKCLMINHKNNPEPFEDFKMIGLNNFDFFSTRYYE